MSYARRRTMRKCDRNRTRGASFGSAGVHVVVVVLLTLALLASNGAAQSVVIGNWESAAPEGWVDWGSGQAPITAPRFTFNSTGATLGTGAVQFNHPSGGYTQWAALKLQQPGNGVDEWRDDFLNSA